MRFSFTLTVMVALACTACSPQKNDPPYTGVLKIDAGTEYAALKEPSTIGGSCSGWSAVEIRKPREAGAGMKNLICWKRENDNITITDRVGAKRTSGPAAVWSD